MNTRNIVNFFEDTFNIGLFQSIDSSLNGLQLGRLDKEINKIGFAVSAGLNIFRKAKDLGCDMLFVHHGIFWGKPERITGYMYERIRFFKCFKRRLIYYFLKIF